MVSGRDLNAYCACGIKNCHENTSLKEAAEKLSKGMQVLIRDGRPVDDESFGGHRPDLSVGRRSIKLDRVEPSIFEVPGFGPSGL